MTRLQRFRKGSGLRKYRTECSEMRLTMQTTVQTLRTNLLARQPAGVRIALGLLLILAFAQAGLAQNPQFNLFKNYFVTGDYVVAGWVEGAPDGSGFAPGTISIPDLRQPMQNGVPASVPKGADIVAAYLYWATVEGNQSTLVGQRALFNSYSIKGTVLGDPHAPVSWSSGGCSGSAQGSKTMRYYRADVRPYLPLDTNTTSPTFGALIASGNIPVRLADSGSNGNTAPFTLGATLVVVYRVLSPQTPLNGIVLYDGIIAPSNAGQNVSQTITGFYQAAQPPVAKLTHIVANGQPNKSESVYLNSTNQPLPSLYGSQPPFPGIYGNWDNPTWVLTQFPNYVTANDTSETTSVFASPTNSGCVSWGAMILSTTVQDTDRDGLLDVWETNQGYTDAVSGQFVALPGANKTKPDIFVELDYLSNLDGSAGPYLHSHLPKQAALDAVGDIFKKHNINLHFDLGPNVYTVDPYVIPSGTGGNAVSEGAALCTDGGTLCEFPGQPAIGWKDGFEFFQNDPTLGNFQPGRSQSYHYILLGHSLGAPRSFWSTLGSGLSDPTIPTIVSIANSGTTATVTIKSQPGVVKPGDCPNAQIPACNDPNTSRVTITGALGQTALNGTYFFKNPVSSPPDANNVTTTTFTITIANVASGSYGFNNEPQLGMAYLGPTSNSGHSDFGGGGDSIVTLGLWGADDAPGCQADPTQPLNFGQVFCVNQVGTAAVETGTLAHELGHALALTHGGAYYNDPSFNPSLPTYEVNCKPNFVSVMNYLFQVRGFVDGDAINFFGFDYSAQALSPLNETVLNEFTGIGPSSNLTRWYSKPNAVDNQVQATTGNRYAKAHCDGTPQPPTEPPSVRVDATSLGSLDWNNDFSFDAVAAPGLDINQNGIVGDALFTGFSDLDALNLQQIGARSSAFGFSQSGGLKSGGGGLKSGGGGIDDDGGGLKSGGGGLKSGGGGLKSGGGGTEQDEDTATSTLSPPTSLTCFKAVGTFPGCVAGSPNPLVSKNVPLTWNAPGYGQIRTYYVWRATNLLGSILSNASKFVVVQKLSGTPPATSWVDSAVKNNNTYTYFVTAINKQGVQSGASNFGTVTVKP